MISVYMQKQQQIFSAAVCNYNADVGYPSDDTV